MKWFSTKCLQLELNEANSSLVTTGCGFAPTYRMWLKLTGAFSGIILRLR